MEGRIALGITALLTLVGYSLNDTIVVYDRIRENMKKFRRMPLPELLDLSVNETLSRTIVTSLSVLITLVALVPIDFLWWKALGWF